jgi:hypothetical protein
MFRAFHLFLLVATSNFVLLEPVEFTGGRVAVPLRTQELNEGSVRVQISAHFRGNGKPTDKFSGQPATMWPLNSKASWRN